MMSKREYDFVEVDLEVLKTTDQAMLVTDDGRREIWLPKSVIDDPDQYNIGDFETILIKEWAAIEKELI